MSDRYRTKTQKKHALDAIFRKTLKLFSSNVFTIKDMETIHRIVDKAEKKV